MEAVLGILDTLKLNNTIWIQLGCFMVAYLAMSQLLFKPYYEAYRKRQERTVGGEETAEKLTQEALEMQESYEGKLRAVNAEFKTIYDQEKSEAQKSFNDKVAGARKEAEGVLEETRTQVATKVVDVQKDLEKEIPAISSAMASKLIGKEISQ